MVSCDTEGIIIHSHKEQSTATTTSNTGSKEGKYVNGAGYQGKLGEGYTKEKKDQRDAPEGHYWRE